MSLLSTGVVLSIAFLVLSIVFSIKKTCSTKNCECYRFAIQNKPQTSISTAKEDAAKAKASIDKALAGSTTTQTPRPVTRPPPRPIQSAGVNSSDTVSSVPSNLTRISSTLMPISSSDVSTSSMLHSPQNIGDMR